MTDTPDHTEKSADKDAAHRNKPGWKTAAGMGIGSAALVAALLYANKARAKKPVKPKVVRED